MENNIKVIKCKSSTDSNKLAGSIFSAYQEGQEVHLRVIGAGSLNQAMKAVIVSNKFASKKGKTAYLKPFFVDIEEGMTAIEMEVVYK